MRSRSLGLALLLPLLWAGFVAAAPARPVAGYNATQLRAAKGVFAAFQRGNIDRKGFIGKLGALGMSYQSAKLAELHAVDPEAFAGPHEFVDKHYDKIVDDLIQIARKNRFVIKNWSQFNDFVSADHDFAERWGKQKLGPMSWIAIRDRRGNGRLYGELEKIGMQVNDGKGPSAAGARRISKFQRERAAKSGSVRGKLERDDDAAPERPAAPTRETSRRDSAKVLAERLAGKTPDEKTLRRIYAELGKHDPNFSTFKKASQLHRTFEGVLAGLRGWNFDPHRPYSLRFIARWTQSAHEAGPGADYNRIAAVFKKSDEYKEDGRLPPAASGTLLQASIRPEIISSWALRKSFQQQRRLLEILRTAPKGASIYQLGRDIEAIGVPQSYVYTMLKRMKPSDAERLGFDRATLAAITKTKKGLGQDKDPAFDANREPPEINLELVHDILATPTTPKLHELALARLDGRQPFRAQQVLFINHRYSDIVPFVDLFRNAGMADSSAVFVSTPYPFKDAVTYQLRDRGIETLLPEQNMASMKKEVGRGLEHLLARYNAEQKAGRNPSPILIIDDGGMAAKVIAEKYPAHIGKFRIVEITAAGDRLAHEFKEQYGRLPFVYNSIAYSEAKRQVTSKFFGTRVVDRIEALLPQTGVEPINNKATVIGGGPMGLFAAQRAKKLGMDVTIVEKDEEIAKALRTDGWKVQPIEKALPGRGLILGMTGYQTVLADHVDLISDGAILAQGSSKRNEFEMDKIEKRATSKVELPRTDGLAQKSYTYTFGRGAAKKSLHFLGDGWTVNHDGSLAGTPIEDIQLEHALIFEAAVEAVSKRINDTGDFQIVGKDSQDYFVKAWKKERR